MQVRSLPNDHAGDWIPLNLEEITSWFRSKADSASDLGVVFGELRQPQFHLPVAAADFDARHSLSVLLE
jgi:hypothetical protein